MSSFIVGAAFFKEQVTENIFVEDIFFGVATISLLLTIMAVGLIDTGLVRRKNTLDTWIQKLLSALLAAVSFLVVGFAIWNLQFNQAFGIPSPLSQSLKDWWIFGPNMTSFAHELDPKVVPSADVLQVFVVFFMAYAGVWAALLHSAGLERVKALPMYIMAILGGGLVMPILAYYTWGSVSPLTNRGVHDYMGVYSLYITVGVFALVLAWRLGPRIGAFTKDPRTTGPHPYNLGSSASGTALLLFAVPFLALGCGYLIADAGYFGISMTTSGFGLVFINIVASMAGGAIGGALIAYRLKNPLFILLGPIAGYVGCGASMDIATPWQCILIAFFAPFAFLAAYQLLYKLKIDDKKIAPLGLGVGIYSVIVAGFVGNGDATGGYFGLEGVYGFQNSTINVGWQLIGLGVTLGLALVMALVIIIGLEKTIGLRVKEADELQGLDIATWQSPPPSGLDEAAYGLNGTPGDGITVHTDRPTAEV